MKTTTTLTGLTASTAAAFAMLGLALAGPGLEPGAAMPEVTAPVVAPDGSEMALAELRGEKGTLIVFTCNTCPWAKAWEERIVALGNEYAQRGIGVVAINSNDPARVPEDSLEAMKVRAAERGMAFPYVADRGSVIARQFGAKVTPEAFLFDAGGTLVYHGTIDDNARAPESVKQRFLKDALEATASGSEIAVAKTKALGCGIKFSKE